MGSKTPPLKSERGLGSDAGAWIHPALEQLPSELTVSPPLAKKKKKKKKKKKEKLLPSARAMLEISR
jgi:hypothetical protein